MTMNYPSQDLAPKAERAGDESSADVSVFEENQVQLPEL